MTVSDLLIKSMKKIGVIASGETPPVTELQDALLDLQLMLRSWASKKIQVYATVSESKVLTANQGVYTWAVGGNINSLRPYEIVSAFIRDSNNSDTTLTRLSKNMYNDIGTKSRAGIPDYYWYNPTYPLGLLYLFPIPDTSYTLYIDSLKPFTELSNFNLISDTFSFPPDYEEAVIYNLCVRLAPEFGKSVPQETIAIAKSTYDALVNLNANNQVESVRLRLPVNNYSTYNINNG
jgi:hypothetical protein